MGSNIFLRFQKKPDGWHIVQCEGSNDKIAKDDIIWSAQTKSFQHINYNPATDADENKDQLQTHLKDYTNIFFSYFPYYNYIGFDWDVIQNYKDKKDLPDSVLYALGRAYSYYSSNLLSNQSGMSDKKMRFNISEGPDALSPEQLATYNKYHDLAIETFKAVQQMNPKFETMVGNISVKLADEYMVGYLEMQEFQNDQEANKELEGCNYDYFMVSTAKDYLMSCDSNAILVTFGDNDTYPLIYVQAKYNYRPDVLIVNNELLGLPFYINRMRRKFIGAQPLPISMNPDMYKNGVRDYIVFYSSPNFYFSAEHPSDLKFDMDFTLSPDTAQKVQLSNGEWANYIPSHFISFPVNKTNLLHSKINYQVQNNSPVKPLDTINWEYKGGYMFKSTFVLLNVLLNNNWKRPICFTSGGDDQYLGLNNYLKMHGTVYEVIPVQNTDETGINPLIVNDEDYDLVMHKFQWGNIASGNYLGPGRTLMTGSLRSAAIALASKLADENKKEASLKVLNLSMDSIPQKICPDDYWKYRYTIVYYQAGDNSKANSISKELFTGNEKKLTGYGTLADADVTTVELIRQSREMLKTLLYYADKYQQHDLYKDYAKRLEALSAKGLFNKDDIAIKDEDK